MDGDNNYVTHLGSNLGEFDLARIIVEKILENERNKMASWNLYCILSFLMHCKLILVFNLIFHNLSTINYRMMKIKFYHITSKCINFVEITQVSFFLKCF